MSLSQIFLDRRQKTDDTQPRRRWSDFPGNRQAAIEGKAMPLNRKPRYKVEDIKFVSREALKELKK
jgi:hypothetical protein